MTQHVNNPEKIGNGTVEATAMTSQHATGYRGESAHKSSSKVVTGPREQPPEAASTSLPLIEIGMVMVGRLDKVDRRAIHNARDAVLTFLDSNFAEFQWRIPLVSREEVPTTIRHEPAALLQDGSHLREAYEWDYGIILTSADLIARYKPFALAVVSRALDLVVISTDRIGPHTADPTAPKEQRRNLLADRLRALCLHALGHLNGLTHDPDPENLMFDLHAVGALVTMRKFSDVQREAMTKSLRQIADQRLEEKENAKRISQFRFYLHSTWINRHEVLDAIWQAKPWQFPVRLMRLSAAAVSATLILMLTAETWHLALTQTPVKVVMLLATALVVTTIFVAGRQGLFVQRTFHRVSEQSVITNVSATVIVFLGMLTTTLFLLAASLVASVTLYGPTVVLSWAGSAAGEVTFIHYLQTAIFVTTVGLLIGALGASFEDQYYFRHIIFVDEET